MANPDHVEIVKQGAEAIKAWRESNPNSILELSDADFSDPDLRETYLIGADLREADFREANLSKANLSRADLRGAKLSEAFLQNADLRNTRLSWACFVNTDLSEADLSDAGLMHVNFTGADLREANLSKARIQYAYFVNTHLSGTNLKYSLVEGTIWTELDLSQVIGLESVQHWGPSSLGVDTFMKSKGQIPEVFLRGCGLSDDFISYIPSHFANSAFDFYSCFISYSHEDKTFARRLHDSLQGRGIRCWLDEKKMLPGDDFGEHIDHGIKVWDKVLLCASKHSLTSYWVNKELEHTFAKEEQLFKRENKPVRSLIPLNLDNYLFDTWEHKEKNSICRRLAADFTDWETDNSQFEKQFEQVVKALQTNDTGREPDPIPKL